VLELLQYARVSCHSEEACVPNDRLLQQVAAGSKVLQCVECVTGVHVCARGTQYVCVYYCVCVRACVCVCMCVPLSGHA